MKYACNVCKDKGYVFKEGKVYAEAEVCSCHRECYICKGKGIVPVEKNGMFFYKPCECVNFKRRIEMFNSAKIPRRFFDKDLENYVSRSGNQRMIKLEIVNYLQNFDISEGVGILLSGPTGVGKTHLMVGLLKYFILDLGLSGEFVDFFEFTGLIKAGYNRGVSEMDLILPILEKDIICIDEFAKGRSTEWEMGILDQFISKAYNMKKTLLLTTNYAIEDGYYDEYENETLKQRVGVRIYSRLKAMCRFYTLIGNDFRTGKSESFL